MGIKIEELKTIGSTILSGDTSISGMLVVNDNVDFNGELNVDGMITFNNSVITEGTMDIKSGMNVWNGDSPMMSISDVIVVPQGIWVKNTTGEECGIDSAGTIYSQGSVVSGNGQDGTSGTSGIDGTSGTSGTSGISGGSSTYTSETINSSSLTAVTMTYYRLSGVTAVYLPESTNQGEWIQIKNISNSTTTIYPTGTNTIDQQLSSILNAYDSLLFIESDNIWDIN